MKHEEKIPRYTLLPDSAGDHRKLRVQPLSVTDVQQEINGLMDIDRNYKIDPEIIREINERTV